MDKKLKYLPLRINMLKEMDTNNTKLSYLIQALELVVNEQYDQAVLFAINKATNTEEEPDIPLFMFEQSPEFQIYANYCKYYTDQEYCAVVTIERLLSTIR